VFVALAVGVVAVGLATLWSALAGGLPEGTSALVVILSVVGRRNDDVPFVRVRAARGAFMASTGYAIIL
jgi:hypothetical protein